LSDYLPVVGGGAVGKMIFALHLPFAPKVGKHKGSPLYFMPSSAIAPISVLFSAFPMYNET
jgi:hypothetical protein